jgi:hypothetical protein
LRQAAEASSLHGSNNAFNRGIDRFLNGMNNGYRFTLDRALRFRFTMLMVTLATFVISVWMFITIPKGFFPTEDTGFLSGSTEVAPDTAFPVQAELAQRIMAIVMKDPAVDYVTSSVGSGGASNQGSIFVALKPKSERGDIQTVISRLRRSTTQVPGINTIFVPVQSMNLSGGRQARAAYQFTMQSGDLSSLYEKSPQLLDRMRQMPQLRDVATDLQVRNPQLVVDIDREKAAAFGVTAEQIRAALYNTYGGRQISTIFTQSADYQVILVANKKLPGRPLGAEPHLHSRQPGRGDHDDGDRLRRRRRGGAGNRRRRRVERADHSARPGRDGAPVRRTAHGEPPGAAAGRDAFLQRDPGRRAVGGERSHPQRGAGDRPAGNDQHELLGRGGAVRGCAARSGTADRRGHPDDLHPAGRALRELHPPADDSVRPRVRRHRRPAGAEDSMAWTFR